MVRYGDAIDIKGIISTVTARLSTGERYYKRVYAMRLTRPSTGESHWLHQDMTMAKVQEKYLRKHPLSEWRFELKMRYFPANIQDLYARDKVTFVFFFDQIRSEYLSNTNIHIDQDAAVQLCCLEIRRYFIDLPQIALDKKSDFEYLERELGMQRFVPVKVLETFKPKTLRKSILASYKKYAHLNELECRFKFLEIVKLYYKVRGEVNDAVCGGVKCFKRWQKI